jgi:hypothetical protein
MALLAGLAITLAVSGQARTQAIGSRALGANKAAPSRCDTDGVTLTQTLSGANVTSVTAAGIASACATGTLSLTVNNGSATSSGSAVVPAGGGSVTVTLASAIAATSGEQIDLVISGP